VFKSLILPLISHNLRDFWLQIFAFLEENVSTKRIFRQVKIGELSHDTTQTSKGESRTERIAFSEFQLAGKLFLKI